MYVCVCHALKERDVQQVTCKGACKAQDVHRHFGVRPQCGRCMSMIRDMVSEPQAKAKTHNNHTA
jgi:bacterioferritin-associated ferredoxin